ncbi:MAG: hypothetical protein GY753_11980 [Gammaproteobacteria bacterium]|nr:hypothetical protein [Gammaproteobacteria bacterium]
MPHFKCVKPTTFRGRQANPGAGISVNDEVAATLEGNACWECQEVKAAPKTATATPAPGKDELEAQRVELLKTATELGCAPRSNTGIKKLEAMIEEAKRNKPDEGGAASTAAPGSIV